MSKIRLKSTSDEVWRYALTVARNGRVMSSTTDASRGASFEDKEVKNVGPFYEKKNEAVKNKEDKVLVEVF